MNRYLIVNADDLGLSPGVNRGILEAHQRGILTSTTAMVNMPAAEAGIRLIQQDAPQVGIGLHINLTTGRPVLPPEQVVSLVQADGSFPYYEPDPLRHLDTLNPAEIAAEIHAQFERFVQLAGRIPDHLDSHHHAAYHHPAAFQTLLDLVEAHHLPIRNGCDWLTDSAYDGPRYVALRQMLNNRPGPRWPRFDATFYDEDATLAHLQAILAALPDGTTELMCHPAYNDHIPQGYAAQREVELAALTDPSVRALIREQGIALITFADLDYQSV